MKKYYLHYLVCTYYLKFNGHFRGKLALASSHQFFLH